MIARCTGFTRAIHIFKRQHSPIIRNRLIREFQHLKVVDQSFLLRRRQCRHFSEYKMATTTIEKICEFEDDAQYTYLSKRNPHTKDGTIRFQAKDHVYAFVSGSKITTNGVVSVTGLLSDYIPPFPEFATYATLKSVNSRFRHWYDNRHESPNPRAFSMAFGKNGSVLWPEHYDSFVPLSVFRAILMKQDVKEVWEHAIPAPVGTFRIEDVSEGWTRNGTELHHHIERLLNEMPSPVPDRLEWNSVLTFLDTCENAYGLKWLRTEMRIGMESLRLAGSTDAIALRKRDHKLILFDWKNSKKLAIRAEEDTDANEKKNMYPPFEHLKATARNKYFLQQNMYKIILKREYGYDIEEMWLVIFPPRKSDRHIRIAVPDFTKTLNQTRAGLMHVLNARLAVVRALEKKEAEKAAAALNIQIQLATKSATLKRVAVGEGLKDAVLPRPLGKRSRYFDTRPLPPISRPVV